MINYHTIAIPELIVEELRATHKSPQYGHPAHMEVAKGYGPCRYCLQTFEAGIDQRLLFTYDPFEGLEPDPLPGPIYAHEAPCDSYDREGGFPDGLRFIGLTLHGYGKGPQIYAQEYITDGEVEPAIERMFDLPEIEYISVRNTDEGCYLLRIEPTPNE